MWKTFSHWVDVAVKWVFLSSENPKQASLTVKFALLWVIPWLVKIAMLACGFGFTCISVDANWLTQLAGYVELIAYYGFALIGSLGALYAFGRKIGNTLEGNNAALG